MFNALNFVVVGNVATNVDRMKIIMFKYTYK